jgi:hypothetical protein
VRSAYSEPRLVLDHDQLGELGELEDLEDLEDRFKADGARTPPLVEPLQAPVVAASSDQTEVICTRQFALGLI